METTFTSLSESLQEGSYGCPKYSSPWIICIHSFKLHKVFARHCATHYDMVMCALGSEHEENAVSVSHSNF